jgi:hypothetical protein
MILRVAKEYKDFLIVTLVDEDMEHHEAYFLKNYLNVNKLPSLRILDVQSSVKRYKFNGQFSEALVKNFLENYIHENLKSFTLN